MEIDFNDIRYMVMSKYDDNIILILRLFRNPYFALL